jgi:malate dehydrogenase (oxaloacetate-decarboxylating)
MVARRRGNGTAVKARRGRPKVLDRPKASAARGGRGLRRAPEAAAAAGLRGSALLNTPLLNKGTAFTHTERAAFGLDGLLPASVETLEQQVNRAYEGCRRIADDLARHLYLRDLQDANEVLFYRLLWAHLEDLLPIVYTPTVGRACAEFSHIYRRPRGLFIAYPHRGTIRALLRNRPNDCVDVIVVTDGERILGLGDLGAGGLGIPIGKLSLYTAIGRIDPARTLPIVLDVGTNNRDLLDDPQYLGWRHERATGAAYDQFIDEFVAAVEQELPGVCLQWEDFGRAHARPILERYRDRLLTFNDDIQGTAAVVLGTVMAALEAAGTVPRDQQVVILGAGSAGIGVADYLRAAMVADGLSEAEAGRRIWIVNRGGLLHDGRADLTPEQRVYAQAPQAFAAWRTGPGGLGLADVVANVRATVLIGLSTAGGAFTEAIVREMARKVDRPIIFPLSNPTRQSEAVPDDLIRWTDGRALVATGSPFPPVRWNGRMIPIAQCNNMFIFPAVGLGVVASGARRVTDAMLMAAARALADCSSARRDSGAPLLPPVDEFLQDVVDIATAVGMEAKRAGLARATSAEALRTRIMARRWTPAYHPLTTSGTRV